MHRRKYLALALAAGLMAAGLMAAATPALAQTDTTPKPPASTARARLSGLVRSGS